MNILKTLFISLLAVVIVFCSGDLFAGKLLYDDFSSGYIDGKKWRQRAYVNEIVNQQYVSKLGNRSPGMGAEISPGIFRNHLGISNPDTIHSIECDIIVEEAILDSADNTKSGAMILGYFYNTNTEGDATGDVFAYLMIGERKNEVEGLEAFWVVAEKDSNGVNQLLTNGNGTISGFNPADPPYNTKISYNSSTGTFTFTVDGYSATFNEAPQYERPAVTKLKSISTGIDATNGSNNGYIYATFDNVKINDALYDDFSSTDGRINTTKWDYWEWVREVSDDGSLRTAIPGSGSNRTVNTVLTERDTPYFEAKVRIDSSTELSTGASGIGRIQGYYFNDTQPPGEDTKYKGDYFVQVRLKHDGDGNPPIATAFVHRSDDENEEVFIEKFSHNFTTAITLDTYYTLAIRFVENERKFIFSCNNETVQWDIPSEITTIYPAYGEHRLLRSRVYLEDGESGFIKVRFDDVYIEKKWRTNPAINLLLLD